MKSPGLEQLAALLEEVVDGALAHDSPQRYSAPRSPPAGSRLRRARPPPRPPSGRAARPGSPAAVTIVTSFCSLSKPMSERAMSLTTTASRCLRSSLPRPRSTAPVAVLGGEAHERLAGAAEAAERGEHVGGRLELDGEALEPGLHDLRVLRRARAEVGHRGGHQQDVGRRELGARRGLELGGARHVQHAHAARALERHVGADQRDLGAAPGGLLGQGQAHASRRSGCRRSAPSRSPRGCRRR